MKRLQRNQTIDEHTALLKQAFSGEPDFTVQHFHIAARIEGCGMYFSTMADRNKIETFILKPLLDMPLETDVQAEQLLSLIRHHTSVVPSSVETDPSKGTGHLLDGKFVLIVNGFAELFVFDATGPENRAIEEPKTEKIVRGPQEGFTELLATNMSLIRKRVKNVELHFEPYVIGQETKTKVMLVFMSHKAKPELLSTVRGRLSAIQTESVLESANIEEWIQDETWTPFPTLYNTERPDVVAAHLLEGRVAILTEGTPMALIAPITFFQFFIAPEDYYQRADVASMLRLLRLLSFVISIFAPSLYVALVNYHQEVIPSALLISLSAQREGVPFPAIIEALIMLFTFELLREAGVRMPKVTGQAISIVGAIVLGQAAVEAGLVSAAMVIVVGITAITNFVTPSFSFGISQRMLQFGYMILAALMGFFGILSGIIFLVIHLVSLKSFGVPYFSPVAPAHVRKWKDTLVRLPWPVLNPRRKG